MVREMLPPPLFALEHSRALQKVAPVASVGDGVTWKRYFEKNVM